MFEFVQRFFGKPPSSTTAKERLRLVLLSDHLSLAPDVVEALKRDLLEVISRYVEVDPANCDVTFEQHDKQVAMLANIPILATAVAPAPAGRAARRRPPPATASPHRPSSPRRRRSRRRSARPPARRRPSPHEPEPEHDHQTELVLESHPTAATDGTATSGSRSQRRPPAQARRGDRLGFTAADVAYADPTRPRRCRLNQARAYSGPRVVLARDGTVTDEPGFLDAGGRRPRVRGAGRARRPGGKSRSRCSGGASRCRG